MHAVSSLATMSSSLITGTTLIIGPHGEVKCSGSNTHGNCGLDPSIYPTMGFATPPTMNGYPKLDLNHTTAVEVTAGGTFSAVLLEDGSVQSFGDGDLFPANLHGVASICAGSDHAAVIRTGGMVDVFTHSSSIQDAVPDERTVQIACGCDHMLALGESGKVYSFGSNAYGQRGSVSGGASFQQMHGLPEATFVASGCGTSGIIAANGEVHTWGRNNYGQLGHSFDDYLEEGVNVNGVNVPFGPQTSVPLYKGTTASFLSLGTYHSAITFENGLVYTFGLNSHGEVDGISPRPGPNEMMRTNHPYVCNYFGKCGASNGASTLLKEDPDHRVNRRMIMERKHKSKPLKSIRVDDGKVNVTLKLVCRTEFQDEKGGVDWTAYGEDSVTVPPVQLIDPVTGSILAQTSATVWTSAELADTSPSGTKYTGFDGVHKNLDVTVPVDTHFAMAVPFVNSVSETDRFLCAIDNANDGELLFTIHHFAGWWYDDSLYDSGQLELGSRGYMTDTYFFSGEESEVAHFHSYKVLRTEVKTRPTTVYPSLEWYDVQKAYSFVNYKFTPVKLAIAGYMATYSMNSNHMVRYSGTNEHHNSMFYMWSDEAKTPYMRLAHLFNDVKGGTPDWSKVESSLQSEYGVQKIPNRLLGVSSNRLKLSEGLWDGVYTSTIQDLPQSGYGCTILDAANNRISPCQYGKPGFVGNSTHPAPTELYDGFTSSGVTGSGIGYPYSRLYDCIVIPLGFDTAVHSNFNTLNREILTKDWLPPYGDGATPLPFASTPTVQYTGGYKALRDTTPYGGVAKDEFFSDAEYANMLATVNMDSASVVAGGWAAKYSTPVFKALRDTTPYGGVAKDEFFSDAEYANMLATVNMDSASVVAGGWAAKYSTP